MPRASGAAPCGPHNVAEHGGAAMKAKIMRAGLAIAMLAGVLQAFGAYIKW
jgi:hypothetical protein